MDKIKFRIVIASELGIREEGIAELDLIRYKDDEGNALTWILDKGDTITIKEEVR